MAQLFPENFQGFGTALQEAYPLLLSMANSMQQGQSPFAQAPQGLAAMMQMQEKRNEKAAQERDTGLLAQMLGGGFGGTVSTRGSAGMPRNQAMAANGGPTNAAAQAMNTGGGRDEFIAAAWPHALRVSQQTGVDPRIVVAQAALESGWGKSAPGNNYFGIKSHGQSGGQTLPTTEVVNGQTVQVNDSFRQYGDMGQSFDGYGSFLMNNPRYRPMLGAQGLEAQVAELARSGYATDPNYGSKIMSIASSIDPPQARVSTRGTSIDPNRLAQVLQSPNISDAAKQLVLQRYNAQTAQPDPLTGRDRYMIADGVMYDISGSAPVPVTQRQEENNTPAAMQTLELRARAAGLEPGTPEYQSFMMTGGKSDPSRLIMGPDGAPVYAEGAAADNFKFTEAQSKDNVYSTRARGALEVLEPVSGSLTSRGENLAEYAPLGLGRELQSDDFQVAKQAGTEFLQAILRKDTGAAITPDETESYGRTYLPQPGDGPAVQEAKRQARYRALSALESGMSPQQMLARDLALIRAAEEADNGAAKNGQPAQAGVAPQLSGRNEPRLGNTISRDQLQTMSDEELLRALTE